MNQTMTINNTNKNPKLKKTSVLLLAILAATILIWGLYNRFVSPTKVALVNFRDFQYVTFLKADTSSFIKLDRLVLDSKNIPDFSGYKVIYILAHGMNLNPEMRRAINDARENGSYIYMARATNKESDLSNISGRHQEYISGYLKNGGVFNYAQLFNYSRKVLEKKGLFTRKVLPPRKIPRDTFFHLGEENYFSNLDEYLRFYKKSGHYKKEVPKVCLFTANIGPQSGSRDHIDALIKELQQKNLNLFPISGFRKRLEFLKQVKPDLAIILPHGRFASGKGDELTQFLKENQIPLLCPVTIFSSIEKWQKDPRGMFGGIMSQSITVPELDGGIESVTIAALFSNQEGLRVFKPIPERIKRFGDRVSRWLALKSIPTAEKKVAVYYYKGPGRNAMDAGGLEVAPSLLNLLKHLKKNGYTTGTLPGNEQKLRALIQKKGPVIGKYAEGRLEQYYKEGEPFMVESNQYKEWLTRKLSRSLLKEVKDQHGVAPGKYMSVEKDGKQYLVVAGIRFGNIVLLPQPLPGEGADDATLIHGVKTAPPHHYIASYFWVRNQFGADAVIHFGTHGSLEFTPEKQVALSSNDWPDILVSDLPHIYLYSIDNIGEAMIAKRRSYAVLASHITPPFGSAQVYGDLEELSEKIHNWSKVHQPLLKQKYAESIIKLIKKNTLHKDLDIPELKNQEIDESVIEKVHDYIHKISESRITKGLYTIGTPYKPAGLTETVMEMSFPQVANCLADIDIANGKVDEAVKKDLHRFSILYRSKSRRIVKRVLEEPTIIPVLTEKVRQFDKNAGIENAQGNETESTDLVTRYETVLRGILKNHDAVKSSFGAELNAITDALQGGYIPPSPGSDPLRNPLSVPTGRNLYAVDAEQLPTEEAWGVGKMLAEQIIEAKQKKSGVFPKRVAISLWGGEFIRGQGTNIAQILYFLGVEPLRNSRGRVHDVRLIPLKELGRPRIDVVVQTSGQFRDLAASRILLLDKAVKLASTDKDNLYDNYIKENSHRMEGVLKEKGLSPEDARLYSTARVFGGVNGNYGTGIMGLVESGDKWEKDSEITEQYLQNMGAIYTENQWGHYKKGLFESALKNVDTIIHPNSSNSNGPLSLDHVYEFMGGLNAAVRNVSGKDPDAWFNDLRDPHRPGVMGLKKAIWMEVRAKFLNPKYIKALQEGSASSAETFAETYRNTYGWNVMKPGAIDKEVWENFYDTYVEDQYNLNIQKFFKEKNPFAYQEMTAVMLESIRKGLWDADAAKVKKLIKIHADWVVRFKPGCSGFVCNNKKLRRMIADQIPAELKKKYNQALEDIKTGGSAKTKEGMVLKKENLLPENISRFLENNWKTFLSIGIVTVFFFLVIIVGRLRRKRTKQSYETGEEL